MRKYKLATICCTASNPRRRQSSTFSNPLSDLTSKSNQLDGTIQQCFTSSAWGGVEVGACRFARKRIHSLSCSAELTRHACTSIVPNAAQDRGEPLQRFQTTIVTTVSISMKRLSSNLQPSTTLRTIFKEQKLGV